MDEIILISTTTALTHTINRVQQEMGTSWPVYEELMVQALQLAKEKIQEGTRVIISRGGTAAYLQKNLPVPVVSIRHSFYDIHLAVQQAKKISNRIGVIGFESLSTAAQDYKRVMDCDSMYIERIEQYSQYEEKIKQMVAQKVNVIIGGIGLRNYEGTYGFKFVAGGGSEYTVRDAIDEALEQLHLDNERRRQENILDAVINSASEGIVGFENNGKIIHINRIAKYLLDYQGQEFIQEVLPVPLVQWNEDGEFAGVSNTLRGEIIQHKHRVLALNTAPISVGGSQIGTVATIQEQDYIQMVDRKIRKELVGRGHIAKNRFEDIVGQSLRMEEVKRIAMRYAESNSTVLITGETGTGKEIFAQSIHNYSARSGKPFVAVNCAALPRDILESELFGYVKGAFTGARSEGKIGIFELAHTGTVFLDEISELSLDVQAKLLRVLQEKEITRVGDDKTIPVDVRIIAACNADLLECVGNKTFRKDLYYRIAVLELPLPPLRERTEDIPALIQQILRGKKLYLKCVEPAAMDILCAYNWPGNIRQLINVMERLDILCENGVVTTADAASILDRPGRKSDIREPENGSEEQWLSRGDLLRAAETELIRSVMQITQGNRERAAAILGISPTTLWRKLNAMSKME